MTTELYSSDASSSALTVASAAERRVQRAKHRLQQHFALLDHRARDLARQTAWVAGMVLLGLAGMAAAATLFGGRSRKRGRSHTGMYYASGAGAGGAGTALMLAAFGLLSRRARHGRTRSYST